MRVSRLQSGEIEKKKEEELVADKRLKIAE
jgi:hypothetical protein